MTKKLEARLYDGIPTVKGPFDVQIIALEWLQWGESQVWYKGVWHGSYANHFGFSLHSDRRAMGRFIVYDKKNAKLREKFIDDIDYSIDEAERRYPSLSFYHFTNRIRKVTPIFVSRDILSWVNHQGNGDGIFIDKFDRKYAQIYHHVLGQYGKV